MMQYMRDNQKCTISDKAHHMLVYIYGINGSEPYGEIVNFYLKETETFQNIGEMVLKLDNICSYFETAAAKDEPHLISIRTAQSRSAKAKALLAVDIECRRYASLQGKVRGNLTKWRYLVFRSGLELMRIFYEILSDGGGGSNH